MMAKRGSWDIVNRAVALVFSLLATLNQVAMAQDLMSVMLVIACFDNYLYRPPQ